MKNKAIIASLLLLLFSTFACESADYAAAFNIKYETTSTTPLSPDLAASETPMGSSNAATAPPLTRVCTGAENGTLRVRKGAGTNEAEVALLSEGALIEILSEETYTSGTWAEIKEPNGWVNKRFLCEESK